MKKRYFASTPFLCFALTLGLLTWTGCGGNPPSDPAPEAAGTQPADDHDHGDEAGLSAVDQALADAQGICPVSGEELGGMGTPVKVMVEDRPVFLCCEPCKGPLMEDPEKHLAKLDAEAPADEPQPESEPAPSPEADATSESPEAEATPESPEADAEPEKSPEAEAQSEESPESDEDA